MTTGRTISARYEDGELNGLWPVALGAGFVLAALCLVVPLVPRGEVSTSMALHIAAMNVVAPTIATIVALTGFAMLPRQFLWPVAAAQLVLLVAWHLPAMHAVTAAAAGFHAAFLVALLAGATLFWLALLTCRGSDRWRAIFALLITGKVACLLGALLIFAPQAVYAHHGMPGDVTDQQVAGLLMIVACPLSYVVAGVVLAAQWLAGLEGDTGPAPARRPL
jgi:putative membrane protein